MGYFPEFHVPSRTYGSAAFGGIPSKDDVHHTILETLMSQTVISLFACLTTKSVNAINLGAGSTAHSDVVKFDVSGTTEAEQH
jgi:hypothetical protein